MIRFGLIFIGFFAVLLNAATHAQASPIVVGAARLAEVQGGPSASKGRVLISELRCASCHADTGFPGYSSDLVNVGPRLSPGYLRAWLTSPHETKPGTTMPDVLTSLDDDARAEVVDTLVHYLSRQGGAFRPDDNLAVDVEEIQRGEDLFHTVGCVACHAPRREPSARIGGDDEFSEQIVVHEAIKLPSVPLPNQRAKTNHASLTNYLFDNNRESHSPTMKLSPEESKAIASYLLSDSPDASTILEESFNFDEEKYARGREAFDSFRCASCHIADPQHKVEILKSIDDVNGGCLSKQTSSAPWYSLSDRQRNSIRLALQAPEGPDDGRRITERLASLNCYACHERDGIGGIEVGRRPYFTAVIEADLGDECRIPPTLTGVGAKLTEKGLTSMLVGGGSVRPYMATRMPQFAEGLVGNLAHEFLEADENPDALPMDVSGLEHHHRNLYGRQLMGTDGLGCISCHNLYGAKSIGIPAIDLATVPDRIRPSWFKQYLLDPSELRPGTRMPAFFDEGKSPIRRVLGGNVDQQIEALWIYLREIDQTRLPVGMEDRGNYELVPADRPILLRTFMKDVGTHAIAVGYPEGTHIAFDALNVRLALAWRGEFISAESTWADRFSPLAEAIGEEQYPASAGMPVAIDPRRSDVVGADAGYRFQGYRLDEEGIPTFLYSLTSDGEFILIEETISVPKDGVVSRRFRIEGNHRTRLFYHPEPSDDLATEIAPSKNVSTITINWKVGS